MRSALKINREEYFFRTQLQAQRQTYVCDNWVFLYDYLNGLDHFSVSRFTDQETLTLISQIDGCDS
jgi:hypothetical protein